jgi:hypothetical protein
MYCRDSKTIYLIHSPSDQPSAVEYERWLVVNKKNLEEWFSVQIDEIVRLNIGVEWDRQRSEEIDNDENCVELKI